MHPARLAQSRSSPGAPDALVLSCVAALALMMSTRVALADVNVRGARPLADAGHNSAREPSDHRMVGVSMDVGVPDGAALGLVIRPRFDWLRIGAAVTHNGVAPGVRLGVTLDPSGLPIGPTFTVEGGHYLDGRVPMVAGSPSVGYNYANFHLGLEVGNRATFRFFLRGGASWLDVRTANFQSATSGTGIGDPSYSGWLAPSGKLGFATYF